MTALIESIATWFGFVGSCMMSPAGACAPFAAFLLIALAASALLAGLLIAYRTHQHNLTIPEGMRSWRIGLPLKERIRMEPGGKQPMPMSVHAAHELRQATA